MMSWQEDWEQDRANEVNEADAVQVWRENRSGEAHTNTRTRYNNPENTWNTNKRRHTQVFL